MGQGLKAVGGNPASPPYRNGPYTWDQQVTFAQGSGAPIGEGDTWYVDGTNGISGSNGKSWGTAVDTIQAAVTLAGPGDTIFVTAKALTDFTGDPTSYAEGIIIPAATSNLSIIGVSRGRTQGGLPQCKVGTTTTQAILTIRAPGCLIANMGFNGSGGTGGGILLDDDYSTKSAFGTTISGCHFKNCQGPDVDDAKEGGAIQWNTTGNAWQVLISGNRFYRNVCDVVLLGTSSTVPQDVVIENNIFSGPATVVDCNLYLAGGSGMNGVIIKDNIFQQLPSYGSNVNLFIDATGCTGICTGNIFGCEGNVTGTALTFKAAGTGANIPTTMHFCKNYGQSVTDGESAELSIA